MEPTEGKTEPRPPVVVVMGHIDHGKTTLLDFIRKTSVAAKESGGITQHIGAYQIEHHGKKITFLDTPGHEAFSAIRSRGATVADVAVLVVAGDEGVKPQTLEALQLIRRSELAYIVAINKIDKPGAEPEKVKGELAKEGVLMEGWGGEIPAVAVSATTGQGIDDLLELIELVAALGENNPNQTATEIPPRLAQGVVIESSLNPRRGALATLIGQQGTLSAGTIVAAGKTFGRIRQMEDSNGQSVLKAPPSLPVEVTGFKEPPIAGEIFREYRTLPEAKAAAEVERARQRSFEPDVITLVSGKRDHILSLVLKADAQGSIEGIVQALKALPVDRVAIEILKARVGPVSDSDLKIAEPKSAAVVGFRVGIEPAAQMFSRERNLPIVTFTVIYELIEFVRHQMARILPPVVTRTELGALAVAAVFRQTPRGFIVGGKVTRGQAKRGALADVVRGQTVLGRGKIAQLQQEKIDVQTVAEGRECGILLESTLTPMIGDVLNLFEEIEKTQEL